MHPSFIELIDRWWWILKRSRLWSQFEEIDFTTFKAYDKRCCSLSRRTTLGFSELTKGDESWEVWGLVGVMWCPSPMTLDLAWRNGGQEVAGKCLRFWFGGGGGRVSAHLPPNPNFYVHERWQAHAFPNRYYISTKLCESHRHRQYKPILNSLFVVIATLIHNYSNITIL